MLKLTDILKAHRKCVLDEMYSILRKKHKQNQNNLMKTTNSMKLNMTESESIEAVAKLALKVFIVDFVDTKNGLFPNRTWR